MKWKCWLLAVFMIFCECVEPYAKAEEIEKYIVYLKASEQVCDSTKHKPLYSVVNKAELDELIKADKVVFYESNFEFELMDTPPLDQSTGRWNLDMINISKAWQLGCYGNDVIVGVIDTGVYPHEALKNNLLSGHNYVDDNDDTTDAVGHGTFVSGIIAAEPNERYMTGIANKAKIVPLKCFDNRLRTTASMVADAIYDAVDVYKCDVINMSFCMLGSTVSTTLQEAVQYALNSGCILVAAVGNDGNTTNFYPAKYSGVIGVGSIDSSMKKSKFSQINATVDFVAPGENIDSITIPKYVGNAGTSFSAPHISAMAAIAKSINKSITPNQFQNILIETATDLGKSGYDTLYGYGLVNAEKMIDKLLEKTSNFMSPILENENSSEIKIYNNTDSEFCACVVSANYDEDTIQNVQTYNIKVKPNEIVSAFGDKGSRVKFMLWDSFEKMMPITPFREQEFRQ